MGSELDWPFVEKGMEKPLDYEDESRKLLREFLRARDISYKQLADMLQQAGFDETERSVSQKVGRGTYRMAFVLRVLRVLGARGFYVKTPLTEDEEMQLSLSPDDGNYVKARKQGQAK